jgi:hypothetical protein
MVEQAETEIPDDISEVDDPFEGFEARVGGGQCRRLAQMCDKILAWHPEAAGWNWDKILGNATLRGHAKAVQGALNNYPNQDPTNILRTAAAYYGYDPEQHEEAIEEYRREKTEKESFPDVSDWEAWTETIWDGYDEDANRQAVGKQYRDAGWTGGRDELEKLTEAILWATESGSEETDNPELRFEING